jgi:hypothetical protein
MCCVVVWMKKHNPCTFMSGDDGLWTRWNPSLLSLVQRIECSRPLSVLGSRIANPPAGLQAINRVAKYGEILLQGFPLDLDTHRDENGRD